MRTIRQFGLAIGVLAAVLLATGTGGFSAMEADRGVTVAVVDDEHAYLGVTTHDHRLEPGMHDVTLLTLTNRFGRDLDVTVTVTDDDRGPPLLIQSYDRSENLPAYTSRDVTADIVCSGQGGSETVTVAVVASSPGVEVQLSRDVTVVCDSATATPTATTQPTTSTTISTSTTTAATTTISE